MICCGSTTACSIVPKRSKHSTWLKRRSGVIRQVALRHLSTTPYSYRKVGARPTLRELIIPFGTTGYILRFDIRSPGLVLVIGARHQRKEDFH